MNIQHEVVSFDLEAGSILVRYYSDELPIGLTYNIDLPFDNGQFPNQQAIDDLIVAMRPSGQMQRIVDLRQAATPTHLAALIPINASTIDLTTVVRGQRDSLLTQSDWSQLPDAPLSDLARAAWVEYRQMLRDVPEQAGFPESVDWPLPPDAEPR